MSTLPRVYLVRHGETAWSQTHRHTGLTDIALTDNGEREARSAATRLTDLAPVLVLGSPLQRATRTAELAGFGAALHTDADLVEWDYGDYEGLTTAQIRQTRPSWDLFRDGCPGGELPEAIGRRADRVVDRLRACDGDALVFAHGHLLRVLAVRWLGLPPGYGRYLVLSTATVSVLGYEHGRDEPALLRWND